jgi:transketolase
MLSHEKEKEFKIFAIKIRLEVIKALGTLGFGHVGGSMSIADTIAVLYGGVMNVDPKNPKWEKRDWLVCSKGHAGPSIYAALGLRGYFPVEEIMTINTPGTHFPSHCDRNLTTGIDMTTGSLGQGASTSVGVALGNRLNGFDSMTYLILGDGESQEGQVWEAASFAAQKKLDHLIAFVDCNKQQLDGYTKDINDTRDMAAKFESFGWNAQTIDGGDVRAIYEAIQNAKENRGKPSVIVLNTVKGRGVAFAEGIKNNHHMQISREQMESAIAQLQQALEKEGQE